jgi:hypothetical protein
VSAQLLNACAGGPECSQQVLDCPICADSRWVYFDVGGTNVPPTLPFCCEQGYAPGELPAPQPANVCTSGANLWTDYATVSGGPFRREGVLELRASGITMRTSCGRHWKCISRNDFCHTHRLGRTRCKLHFRGNCDHECGGDGQFIRVWSGPRSELLGAWLAHGHVAAWDSDVGDVVPTQNEE